MNKCVAARQRDYWKIEVRVTGQLPNYCQIVEEEVSKYYFADHKKKKEEGAGKNDDNFLSCKESESTKPPDKVGAIAIQILF